MMGVNADRQARTTALIAEAEVIQQQLADLVRGLARIAAEARGARRVLEAM